MLHNKQKQILKIIFIGVVFLFSLGIFNSGKILPATAKAAAYKCDPKKTACCQTSEGNSEVADCKSSYIVVGTNGNSHPELGHCYTVKKTGYGPLYFNASCVDPPFNAYASAEVDCNDKNLNESNCRILYYLVRIINVLSAMVGLVIVSVIIVAGIQFSSAGNDPQKVAAARNRIINAIIALATFIFMYAFLQWVVPGGIF